MNSVFINNDWKFTLEETIAPQLPETDDCNWDTVNLPHDWTINLPQDFKVGHPCTGYFVGGLGWYRKHLVTTKEMASQKVILNFDGIYCRSHVYCNGERVAFHPNGYSPLLVDVTDFLNPVGEDNVIAVRVDHTRHIDSRWYTGSGIYRKVSMHVLPQVHIPVWGIFVTTEVLSDKVAKVNGEIKLVNDLDKEVDVTLETKIIDENGKVVATTSEQMAIAGKEQTVVNVSSEVGKPKLWEILNPYHYTYEVKVLCEGQMVHEDSERFGIRSFEFNPNKGFIFNGKKTLIKGVCLHHDAGLVGAAVPKDVWRRRLNVLIDGGCNAIRTAHNPMDVDFLDLCDELGLLVQEEFYDEWDNPKDKRNNGEERSIDDLSRSYTEYFRDYSKADLQNVVLRDRNHPSIIQWSIGNEIEWTYTKYNNATGYFGMNASGDYFYMLPPNDIDTIKAEVRKFPKDHYDIDTTAGKLSKWTKELDTTRPITANCILPTVSYETGYTDALDLIGFSYRRVIYDYALENYPDKPVMGTENVPQWHEWRAVIEREHVPGIFLWTGIDHMGEAQVQGPDERKGSNVGIVDLAGFGKPAYHMFKALWNEEAYVSIFTQSLGASNYVLKDNTPAEEDSTAYERRKWWWHDVNRHWNYVENEPTVVEVYSNCEEVSLYLGDELVETKYLKDFEDHIYKWHVPFKEGRLKAIGIKGAVKTEKTLSTTTSAVNIHVAIDKTTLEVNFDSVAHVVGQLVDKNNNPITSAEALMVFEVKGDGALIGVDNGHTDNTQSFRSDRLVTSDGHALGILRGTQVGEIEVRVTCPELGIASDWYKMEVK